MLSYRHAFHAGNAADVLKHAVLICCLDYLGRKEKPFLVIDTHAGAGFYSLTEGYAAQNREWEGGVGRLPEYDTLPPLLGRYAALVRDSPGGLYPGSPALIQRLLRPRDQAVCFELHPADFTALEAAFKADKRFRLLREDGLGGLKALLPPPSRRACIFIDPPYEVKSDYTEVPERLAGALARFPTGLYITWYPLLQQRSASALRETLLGLYGGNRCAVELCTAAPDNGAKRMYGSGMVIYNPPWTLRETLEESLPVLAKLLGGWQWRCYL
ncbi:MAG: 23S rRNA (adenine(2030)-N(6))-methyltransferase RlmJ [Treponema sp.]|jgi:23S rRNA (adenine2030-N6)-methyltransferase|nr:23S rRNA (adenine(2030)-N(6))-methyltransferase RlmJ [Treponema sp.]